LQRRATPRGSGNPADVGQEKQAGMSGILNWLHEAMDRKGQARCLRMTTTQRKQVRQDENHVNNRAQDVQKTSKK